MEHFFRQIEEFSVVKLLGAGVLILGLTAYLYYQLMLKEDLRQVESLSERLDGVETQMLQQQRKARNLPALRRKVEELNIQLARVAQELPERREIPQLLATVSDLARAAGLDVLSFRPRGENYRDFYAEVPVDVEVTGTYHQVASFFDEVANLDRIVNIGNITAVVYTARDADVRLRFSFVATTFRYLDDDERARTQQAADGARRGRRR